MSAFGWAAAASARALVLVDGHNEGGAPPDPLDHGERRWIDGHDGHHLQRVRRLQVDEAVVVADGAGSWYLGNIVATRDGAVEIERVGDLRVEPVPEPRLVVAFAPARVDHGAEVARQLVELGVDEIVPLVTRRGVVRWEGSRGVKGVERLKRVVREAAMQAHRARLPSIAMATEIREFRSHPAVLVGASDGAAIPAGVDRHAAEWVVLVGPEGGFAPDELDVLERFTPVAVGHSTLRSVTASVAISAVLSSLRDG